MPFFSPVVAANKSKEPQTVIQDQLAWMIDPLVTGNVNDLVGNINGTFFNGAFLDADNVITVDGVNDYVDFGNQTGTGPVGLSNLDNFTICAWHYSTGNTSIARLISKGDSDGEGGWSYSHRDALRLFTNGGLSDSPASYSIGWRLYDGVSIFNWVFDVIRANKNDPTNYPRDLRFTSLNGTNNVVANNDVAANANGTQINIQNATAPLRIGGTPNGRYAASKVGEVMIYHKTLSDAEIQHNFDVTKSKYGY